MNGKNHPKFDSFFHLHVKIDIILVTKLQCAKYKWWKLIWRHSTYWCHPDFWQSV